jgi:hypothetical protein
MFLRSRFGAFKAVLLAFAVALAGGSQFFASQQDDEAAQRERNVNNLKQLALAMHHYHDAHKEFPTAAYYDKDGKALLSWRVAILPYLAQKELYMQFNLDEAWDSEHNIKLLAKMPATFAPDRNAAKQKGYTYYQVFTGKGTAFDGKKGLRIPADFPDGTSNTILIVEGKDPVPWTKPADLPFDAKKPLPKLGGQFEDGFYAALADGSVRLVRRTISERTLRDAITRDDGNVLGSDW